MNHKTLLLAVFFLVFLITLLHIIKNRPDYLVLVGIRGLLSYFMIQLIQFLCIRAHLPALILANPVTLATGGFLGFPGIFLLYALRLYL